MVEGRRKKEETRCGTVDEPSKRHATRRIARTSHTWSWDPWNGRDGTAHVVVDARDPSTDWMRSTSVRKRTRATSVGALVGALCTTQAMVQPHLSVDDTTSCREPGRRLHSIHFAVHPSGSLPSAKDVHDVFANHLRPLRDHARPSLVRLHSANAPRNRRCRTSRTTNREDCAREEPPRFP